MDNNIQGRIDDYLDQVFGPYEESPTVAELRLEIRHDLLERLNDLIGAGVGDEVAYAQVISSVGDIEEMIKDLAAQDRAYDEGPHTGEPDQSGKPDQSGGAAVPDGDTRAASEPPHHAEPEGPAESIPEGRTPGQTWDSGQRTGQDGTAQGQSDVFDDLASSVADAVSLGLDAARTQFSWAMKQAEEALNRAGVWNDNYRRARERQRERQTERERRWERRWQNRKMSFAASDMRGADFRNQDLPNTSFVASSMRGANFTGATLTGSSFTSSDLRGAAFNQADLTRTDLTACSLRDAQFERTILAGATMTCSDIRNVYFVGADLRDLRATYADLRGAQFNDCVLDGASFGGADLRGARFDGLVLTGVSFDRANLSETSFRGSTLHHVSFHHISRKSVMSMIFADTVMDRATYLSLQTAGYTPQGIHVED